MNSLVFFLIRPQGSMDSNAVKRKGEKKRKKNERLRSVACTDAVRCRSAGKKDKEKRKES